MAVIYYRLYQTLLFKVSVDTAPCHFSLHTERKLFTIKHQRQPHHSPAVNIKTQYHNDGDDHKGH